MKLQKELRANSFGQWCISITQYTANKQYAYLLIYVAHSWP